MFSYFTHFYFRRRRQLLAIMKGGCIEIANSRVSASTIFSHDDYSRTMPIPRKTPDGIGVGGALRSMRYSSWN